MATPTVQKYPFLKDQKDFDNCDNVNSASARGQFSPPKSTIGPCRFSCTTWCHVCEKQRQIECRNRVRGTTDVLVNRYKTSENINDIKDVKQCASFNVDYDYKKVVAVKLPVAKNVRGTTNIVGSGDMSEVCNGCDTHEISLHSNGDLSSKSWVPPSTNSPVHDVYLREVQILRDKLRQLRDNLPPTPEFLKSGKLSISSLKLDNSRSGSRSNSGPVTKPSPIKIQDKHIRIRDQKRSRTPEGKKIEKDNDSDQEVHVVQSMVASLKRPRDGSPVMGKGADTSVSKLADVVHRRLNGVIKHTHISSSLECLYSGTDDSEDDTEKNTKEKQTNSIGAGDMSPEDVAKSISKSLKMTPSPPRQPEVDHVENTEHEDSILKGVQTEEKVGDISALFEKALRPSLFPYVPPYIRFNYFNTQVKEFPQSVHRILKWKLTSITPIVVRRAVTNSGYKLVRRAPEWTGSWGKHMKSICFRTLRDNQKLNHFPGTFQIGRKDRLWKNLYRLMTKFGKKEFGFIPRTYVLPQDHKLLRMAWEQCGTKARWIIKPPAAARGSGIKVVHKWTQIPKRMPLIVQKYISNPYLINGSKFDLRLYVLVTSFNPLRIYLYDNGLVRFASVKYSDDMNTLTDRYMHLTNYSINKLSSQYVQNEEAEACQGHKWTIKTLWSFLQGSVNVEALWENLTELVIKTLISGENSISQLAWAHLPSRYCSYELFGVDVLLDEYLKPWLLEVNISPSLHSASPLDLAVKAPMIQDILNIAGYHVPNKLLQVHQTELIGRTGLMGTSFCYDPRMYIMGLSQTEKNKQEMFSDIQDRSLYLDSILSNLTPDDVRHLIQYEDELTQLGSFEKIFPTHRTHRYHKFFESPPYYNFLFDAWETRYHKNRNHGIKLLDSLCQKQMHLDVSQVESRSTEVYASEGSTNTEDSETDRATKSSGVSKTVVVGEAKPVENLISSSRSSSAVKFPLGKLSYLMRPYSRRSYIVARRHLHHTNKS